jgi:hypothetical protein
MKAIRALLLAAGIAAAQEAPSGPTFRAGTDLVQVSAVADLPREEFQIFDNGVAQEVRLFQAETGKSGLRKNRDADDSAVRDRGRSGKCQVTG